jgi:hypothetical protein
MTVCENQCLCAHMTVYREGSQQQASKPVLQENVSFVTIFRAIAARNTGRQTCASFTLPVLKYFTRRGVLLHFHPWPYILPQHVHYLRFHGMVFEAHYVLGTSNACSARFIDSAHSRSLASQHSFCRFRRCSSGVNTRETRPVFSARRSSIRVFFDWSHLEPSILRY